MPVLTLKVGGDHVRACIVIVIIMIRVEVFFVRRALYLTYWFHFVLLASVLVEGANTADLVSVLRQDLTFI